MTKQLWIVQYHHRHGTDTWPVYSAEAPDLEAEADALDDFEEDRDEYLELSGPFPIPSQ